MQQEKLDAAIKRFVDNGGEIKRCGVDVNEFSIYQIFFQCSVKSDTWKQLTTLDECDSDMDNEVL